MRKQEEWERLGLEKRIDYDNLKRVFERLDLKKDGRIDQEELADMYKVRACSLAHERLSTNGRAWCTWTLLCSSSSS